MEFKTIGQSWSCLERFTTSNQARGSMGRRKRKTGISTKMKAQKTFLINFSKV